MKTMNVLSALILSSIASVGFAQSGSTSTVPTVGLIENQTGFNLPTTLTIQKTGTIKLAHSKQQLHRLTVLVELDKNVAQEQFSCKQVAEKFGLSYGRVLCNKKTTDSQGRVKIVSEGYDAGNVWEAISENDAGGFRTLKKRIREITYTPSYANGLVITVHEIRSYLENYNQTWNRQSGATYIESTFAPIMVGDITTFIPVEVQREYPYNFIDIKDDTTDKSIRQETVIDPTEIKLVCLRSNGTRSPISVSPLESDANEKNIIHLSNTMRGYLDFVLATNTVAAGQITACHKDDENAKLGVEINGVINYSAAHKMSVFINSNVIGGP